MDSLTQMALGSAVSVAVMGRSQPIWKSALFGAVVGTLPDLDALLNYGDGITNMVRHRGETHSLFYQTLAAPVFALILSAFGGGPGKFMRWWLMAWLVLVTHAGLDAMTVYGTQLLLPRASTPFGVGSIFIIDPLYTVPLILGLVLAWRSRSQGRLNWNYLGLIVSSAYLAWSVYAQHLVTEVVARSAAGAGLPAEQVLVTPTPFNTVLWRVVLIHPDRYEEGFYSLIDPLVAPEHALRVTAYDRGSKLDAETPELTSANKLRAFTHGFYAMQEIDNSIQITDLRMGQYPYFSFTFEVARRENNQLAAVTSHNVGAREGLPLASYFKWLFNRARASTMEPPSL